MNIESSRQKLQKELDARKTQEQRNAMGQFSTPYPLALDILKHANKLLPKSVGVRFLDPAVGTGVFYSALNQVFDSLQISRATGFEIDEHYGKPSAELWKSEPLEYHIADFTQMKSPKEGNRYNLLICNPPYVRHHHINNGDKPRLHKAVMESANIDLSGLAGLYCYFLGLSHTWLEDGGVAGWLIPSEFMDVNYGSAVKKYLLEDVTLLHIHRFNPNDMQFSDALVSSSIVWFKKAKPKIGHTVLFTYGGPLESPTTQKHVSVETLKLERKWTRFPLLDERKASVGKTLGDYFSIKRGIATGDNKYFILTKDEIEMRGLPIEQFRPILPSPRYLKATIVNADHSGVPMIENGLFVLDCKLPLDSVRVHHPKLYEYLKEGIESGVSEKYLCKSRKVWYSQENRKESSFYCTYIGRSDAEGKKPFRFILNRSQAIVTNSYLILYPYTELEARINADLGLGEKVVTALNTITDNALLGEGRVYGGGMHKLEPKELANVPAVEIERLLSKSNLPGNFRTS